MATNQKQESAGVQPQQSNVKSNDMVGSLLSLITKAQVRYEGTLVEVDKTERTMNLKNVRSFGTEGRRGGVGEVPANDNEYPEVTFKVDLIKDFKIVKK
jgi:protein LSM14